MRNLAIATTILLAFNVNPAFSQQEVKKASFTGGVTSLISWIVNLDVVIANIHETQKLKRISRLLGDASVDIDEIAAQKELLVFKLSKVTPQNKQQLRPALQTLTNDILENIDELIKNLNGLKSNLSNVDQPKVEDLIQAIDKEFRVKKQGYFDEIKLMLDSNVGSIDRLRKDAQESKEVADEANQQVKLARAKVFERLKGL